MNKKYIDEVIKETEIELVKATIRRDLIQEDLSNLSPDLISKDNPDGMNNRKMKGFYKQKIQEEENKIMLQERALKKLKSYKK